MLVTIQGGDNPHYQDLLKVMFAERKRVFVDLLGWDVPVLAGQFEIDQFDDADATYLIVLDETGQHIASTRLLLTNQPHILDTLYRDLCYSPVPCGASTREITRFCLSRRLNSRSRRVARNRLVTALAEYALLQGITTYTGVAEIAWLQQILAFGWDCRPLGIPRRYGTQTLGALCIRITTETPQLLRAEGVYDAIAPVADPVREVA